jgi:hypothetical protein
MAKAKTPLLLAQALRAAGLPENGCAKFTVTLLRALDERGLILMPHAAGPQMLDAAIRCLHSTGYIVGSASERKVVKQSIRYRAMVEAERRRLGVHRAAGGT